MAEQAIRVEQLASGLNAAFVSWPYFRTTSARLTVFSGAMHETKDAYGAAHFLEHICFQGTEGLPSEVDIHNFVEKNGLYRNAFTGQTDTSYNADGYALDPVVSLVTQLAFKPSLTDEALNGERRPITEEIRGEISNPYFFANTEHFRASRGDLYARPICGSIEDVAKITPENLRGFHARNYRLGNAVLVVCSPETAEKQREYAESIIGTVGVAVDGEPVDLDIPEFNPLNLDVSLQLVDLPLDAQTAVSIQYGIPETTTLDEQYQLNLMGIILSNQVHRRLRSELALCYGANASVNVLSNLQFGRNQNWPHLKVSTSLGGEDSVTALDALRNTILQPLPASVFESTLLTMRRKADHLMQSNPAQVADTVRSILAGSKREEISLEEAKDFADGVTIEVLRKLHRDLMDTKPLILATSPDPGVLDRIGEWATTISP